MYRRGPGSQGDLMTGEMVPALRFGGLCAVMSPQVKAKSARSPSFHNHATRKTLPQGAHGCLPCHFKLFTLIRFATNTYANS